MVRSHRAPIARLADRSFDCRCCLAHASGRCSSVGVDCDGAPRWHPADAPTVVKAPSAMLIMIHVSVRP